MFKTKLGCLAAAFLFLFFPCAARAENVAHWNLDGDLSSSSDAEDLVLSAFPGIDPSIRFASADIDGAEITYAVVEDGNALTVRHGLNANGGGSYLNSYTLVMDVRFPETGDWISLYQTNSCQNENGSTAPLACGNDGDWFLRGDGAIGISGNYSGSITANRWHRLALVVDSASGAYISYIDGTEVQRNAGAVTVDGRFSLYPAGGAVDWFLLFADESGGAGAPQEMGTVHLNAVQLRDAALCPAEIALLGEISDGPLDAEPVAGEECAVEPPAGDPGIKEGPYLQWVTPDEITIMWETLSEASGTVRYRRAGEDWQESSHPGVSRIHEVRLEGLAAGQEFEYLVRSEAGAELIESAPETFTTAPEDRASMRFTVWGDNQANPSVFSEISRLMAADNPDIAVGVGDVVNNGDVYAEWGVEFLSPLQPLSKNVPFYVAIGNHERNSHWFYDYLAQPGNEHWFSFDYAGCHFVIFDSNFPFMPGSEQYQWLYNDLFSDAAQNANWLLVFHHHPAYSEIYEETRYAQLRMHVVPLLETAGVDVDFTGHIHDYERGIFTPPDTGRRIAYIQTSGAGGRLWEDEFDGEWDQIQRVVQYVHHYVRVDVTEDTLVINAIDREGDSFDSIRLNRMPRTGEAPEPPPPINIPPELPSGEAITQWDFTSGNLEASRGAGSIQYSDGPNGATASATEFGSTSDFDIAPIDGEEAQVMKFPKAAESAMGFLVTHGAVPNGDGNYVNDYSLVFDMLVPSNSFDADGWLSLLNTNASNSNDGDLFINLQNGGIGISGNYSGNIRADTWHRVAFVFSREGGSMILRKYIDGQEVGEQSLGAADGRWAMYSRNDATPFFYTLTDDNGQTSGGYLSSFLFVDGALSAEEIDALGPPDADGILEVKGGCEADCPPVFLRGMVEGAAGPGISDAVFILNYLFTGGRAPGCMKAADVNDTGVVDLTDAVYLLNYLFIGGAAPAEPVECGEDPTEDELSCETPTEACQ